MCGRIVVETPPEQLSLIFDADLAPEVDPRACIGYNVAPTDTILGIVASRPPGGRGGSGSRPGRVLGLVRWGLAPPWRSPRVLPANLFNARGETLATKPAFRSAFVSRRLIIPVDGFYEWGAGPGKVRQPYFFSRADHRPLALAGLWEPWAGAGGAGAGEAGAGEAGAGAVRSCAIVTTGAGPDMAGIHHRMPVILDADRFDAWLDPTNDDRGELQSMVRAARPGTLVHHPVDVRVGSVRNDGPELTQPVEPGDGPGPTIPSRAVEQRLFD